MPTWFLPPDFTFKPEGKLSLGMVIAHPNDPTNVLAVPGSEVPPIPLPEEERLVERKHVHSNEMENSVGLNLLARFADLCSGSTSLTKRRLNTVQYSEVDHEVRTSKTPFTDDMLRAIVRIPKVRNHIKSSLFGTRPVYVVSGLRVAMSSFTVTRVAESDSSADASASAALPAGPVPGEVGGGISGAASGVKSDSYETAPGIVFAYQLYTIRPRGDDNECPPQTKLFSSRDGFFMAGEGGGEGEEMDLDAMTEEVLDGDQDESAQYQDEAAEGDHFCISFV